MTPNELYQKSFTEGKTIKMIPVTYVELVDTMLAGKLIPGMQYRITDFVTKVKGESLDEKDIMSTETPFDIIVTAINKDTISENCSAARNANDGGYFSNTNFEKWSIKYTVDPIIYENACLGPAELEVDNDGNTEWINYVGIHSVNGAKKAIFASSDPMYYYSDVLYPKSGTVLNSCERNQNGELVTNSTTEEYWVTVTAIDTDEEGKGFIYEMTDEYNNTLPYDFKSIKFDDSGTYRFSFELYMGSDMYCDATVVAYDRALVFNNKILTETDAHSFYSLGIPHIRVDCGNAFSFLMFYENKAVIKCLTTDKTCTYSTFVGRCKITGTVDCCYIENVTINNGNHFNHCRIFGDTVGETIVTMSGFDYTDIYLETGGLQGGITINPSPYTVPKGSKISMEGRSTHYPRVGSIFGVEPGGTIVHLAWDSNFDTWSPVTS